MLPLLDPRPDNPAPPQDDDRVAQAIERIGRNVRQDMDHFRQELWERFDRARQDTDQRLTSIDQRLDGLEKQNAALQTSYDNIGKSLEQIQEKVDVTNSFLHVWYAQSPSREG